MKRFCARHGCANVVDRGYCDECKEKAPKRQPMDPRYWQAEWRRYSKAYLAEHTRCVRCGRLSQVVDHVVPVVDAPERFHDPTNHQSLCRICNNEKAIEDERKRR